MSTGARVVLYGRDRSLLETRSWVLQAAGLSIVATSSGAEAEQALAAEGASVLVLCQSLRADQCERALMVAHGTGRTRVLILAGPASHCVGSSEDEVLSRLRRPEDLVRAVERLAAHAAMRA